MAEITIQRAVERIAELECELEQYRREGIQSAFPKLLTEVNELTAKNEQLRERIEAEIAGAALVRQGATTAIEKLERENEQLRAEWDALREAVAPFIRQANQLVEMGWIGAGHIGGIRFEETDWRRLAAAGKEKGE